MQQEMDFRRLLKMKIKYELEASDFASEEELKRFMEEAKKSPDSATQELTNLLKGYMDKLQPAIKDITLRFAEGLSSVVADVTAEAAVEIVMSKLKKMLENQS